MSCSIFQFNAVYYSGLLHKFVQSPETSISAPVYAMSAFTDDSVSSIAEISEV